VSMAMRPHGPGVSVTGLRSTESEEMGVSSAGSRAVRAVGTMRRVALHAAYGFVAALALAAFLHQPGIQHWPPSAFGRMVSGTANKPYVFRALVPLMIRATMAEVPEPAKAWWSHAAETAPLAEVLKFCDHIPAQEAPEFFVAVVIMYAALVGFCFALRYLCNGVFRAPPSFVDAVPLFALALLPPFFVYTSFLYDFPALFFFTAGLGLMFRERWRAYFVVFVLSCVNKETTILLTLVFALHFFRGCSLNRIQFFGLLGAQAVVYVPIKLGLDWLFRDNAGFVVESHLDHNFELLRPYPPSTAVAWLALAVLTIGHWSEKPVFLRRALWILVPLLGLTTFLGMLDELRDFYEAVPIVVLLMSHSVAKLAGIDVRATGAKLPSSAEAH
jgi:hypothetical protein